MTKLTDNELNKRIHEILGLKYYEGEFEHDVGYNHNFCTEWRAFGLMFEFMQKHERREDFLWAQDGDNCCLPISLISPRPFAEAMCEFFGRENEQ